MEKTICHGQLGSHAHNYQLPKGYCVTSRLSDWKNTHNLHSYRPQWKFTFVCVYGYHCRWVFLKKKVSYFLFCHSTILNCCQILVCETIILSWNCWSCYCASFTCFFLLSTKLFWQVILTERTLIKENLFLQGINDFMQLATPVNVSLVRISFHMELLVISF